MTEITVEAVMRQGDRMMELIEAFARGAEKLKESLECLNSSWRGPAQQAVALQFQKEYQTMKDMETFLLEMQQLIEYAKEEYQRCAGSAADLVASI